jgi:16S rRNA (guanine966-N2)-methyltransferase
MCFAARRAKARAENGEAMRIIAGQHKGRAIAAPKGQGTRPTADRARESVFNVLAHAPWAPEIEGARVIDLFAGSGALGLEAVSRGAAFCLFVETDHAARGAIRDNIETLGLYGNTRIHRRSATDLGEKPAGVGSPFTIAFLDPPYHKDLVRPALACLAEGKWLAEDAIAVVETASDELILPEGWEVLDTRDYGAARVWFLKQA